MTAKNPAKQRQGGFAEGNADAIYRQRKLIREFAPDLIVVLSADHVYKLDYRDVLEQHRASGADVTLVTTHVPPGDPASRFGVVQTGPDGRVTDFAYKPKKPQGDMIAAEVFVYTAGKLLGTLDEIASAGGELKDYGDELLPRLVKAGNAWAFPLEGYWRDVGTVQSYWQAHMDLLASKGDLALDDPVWPILTYGAQRLPAHLLRQARVSESLIAPGGSVNGTVRDSILAPDVIVEEGAQIEKSIILHGARIKAGARVRRAIVDEKAEIGANAEVGGEGDLTVVGSKVKVAPGRKIEAGEEISPG